MASEQIQELLAFVGSDNAKVRLGAMEAVMGLTAADEGRQLLRDTNLVSLLRRLLGDRGDIASAAVSTLVNLSADAQMMDQILRAGTISLLMDLLRDDECSFKRTVVMLLVNLTQTPEGCDQVLQKSAVYGGGGATAALGLHFRRFIQLFVKPVPAATQRLAAAALEDSSKGDDYEYIGEILHNVSQLPEARAILVEAERGILPALLPQLRSVSHIRRRGIAGTLRNLCLETEEGVVAYLLSGSVDLSTHLLFPLAGPDNYLPGEADGMHASLTAGGAHKQRERDPLARRWLVEALCGLALTRPGREALRRCRAYPVVKSFHEWLEESGRDPSGSPAAQDMDALDTSDEPPSTPLSTDDEATVAAVNRLVDQLFREDEVKHTTEVTGRRYDAPPQRQAAAQQPGAGEVDDFVLPTAATPTPAQQQERQQAAALAQLQQRATVPLAVAQAKAAAIARHGFVEAASESGGQQGGGGAEQAELDSLKTPVPDWVTEE